MSDCVEKTAGDKWTDETLEEKLVARLKELDETICFAESCTGGMCSARLVNVPDASKVMALGLVTYAEEMKVRYLGVSEETLAKYSVVSSEVAGEMALGAVRASGADVGVGITGLAGPGDWNGIPAGTVCFGFSYHGEMRSERLHFDGDRNAVRDAACEHVFRVLTEEILV
ncbi:MAG: CinA family protein [Lachnospiraceae bacterium]|nr:CinA family protein [Lachnospiraceae bacterium]